MAELADALDLGSSGVTHTGSIPASRTKTELFPQFLDYVLKIWGFSLEKMKKLVK